MLAPALFVCFSWRLGKVPWFFLLPALSLTLALTACADSSAASSGRIWAALMSSLHGVTLIACLSPGSTVLITLASTPSLCLWLLVDMRDLPIRSKQINSYPKVSEVSLHKGILLPPARGNDVRGIDHQIVCYVFTQPYKPSFTGKNIKSISRCRNCPATIRPCK